MMRFLPAFAANPQNPVAPLAMGSAWVGPLPLRRDAFHRVAPGLVSRQLCSIAKLNILQMRGLDVNS
jgi:hypothetical protein